MTESKKISVTEEDVRSQIHAVKYHIVPETTTTVCCIVLKNGFTFTGDSICLNSNNFDKEFGRGIAFESAFRKIRSHIAFAIVEDQAKAEQQKEDF